MDRRAFIKKINWVLASGISMLGFANCEKFGTKEYGVPHADYTVKGAVTNKKSGKPVGGIRVGYFCESCPVPDYGTMPTPYTPKSYVMTNTNGEFKLTDRFYAGEYMIDNKTLPVFFEDVDGEKNGLFQTESVQVDFSKAERTKKSKGWYEGEFTVTKDIELTEITSQ